MRGTSRHTASPGGVCLLPPPFRPGGPRLPHAVHAGRFSQIVRLGCRGVSGRSVSHRDGELGQDGPRAAACGTLRQGASSVPRALPDSQEEEGRLLARFPSKF